MTFRGPSGGNHGTSEENQEGGSCLGAMRWPNRQQAVKATALPSCPLPGSKAVSFIKNGICILTGENGQSSKGMDPARALLGILEDSKAKMRIRPFHGVGKPSVENRLTSMSFTRVVLAAGQACTAIRKGTVLPLDYQSTL